MSETQNAGPGGAREYGAGTRTRTADLRFTKPLLYQLSYTGVVYGLACRL